MTRPFSEKKMLILLTLIQFAHTVDFVILMPLGPRFMRAFQIGPKEFSWMVSSYAISASLMSFLSAAWIDRYDRKKSLLFFFWGFAIGTFLCAIAPNHNLFILARTITGAFGGVLSAQVLAIIGDVVPAERRGAATGQVLSAFSIASVVGIPIGLALANAWDWHAPFYAISAIGVILWIFSLRLLPPVRAHLSTDPDFEHQHPFLTMKELVLFPGVMYALVFSLVLVFSAFVIIPMLSPSMVNNGGVLEKDLPLIYLCGGVVTFFTSRWIGKQADLHGKKKVFRIMALISTVPIFLNTHLIPLPLSVIIFLSTLLMFSFNGRYVPTMALLTGVVPPNKRGNFMNLLASVQQLSLALGSLVCGFLVTRNPENLRLMGYENAGYLAIFLTVLCAFTVKHVKSS